MHEAVGSLEEFSAMLGALDSADTAGAFSLDDGNDDHDHDEGGAEGGGHS